MALSRVKVWIPGDVLTAADQNAEFNNILNNPITLVSPTTGAINFNLQANTNFVLENVATTPTAGTSGRIVYDNAAGLPKVDQGTVVRSIPLVLATQLSTGSLLVFTSSGGFGTISNGTSGQILTVTSSGTSPAFAAAASASGAFDPEATLQLYEDFFVADSTTYASATGVFRWMNPWNIFFGAGGSVNTQLKGVMRISSQGGNPGSVTYGASRVMVVDDRPWAVSMKPTFKCRVQQVTTSGAGTGASVGMADTNLETTALTNAIYFVVPNTTGVILANTAAAGVYSTASLGVTATGFHSLRFQVLGTSQVDFYVDGALTTSITTNIPAAATAMGVGFGVANNAGAGIDVDYIHITSTR